MRTLDEIYSSAEDFLGSLKTEVDVKYHIDVRDLDFSDAYSEIYQKIDDNSGFDGEIIYYSNAMEFLRENDPSLRESLGIASEYGFETEGLNSEILASLLNERMIKDEFSELEDEINEFFESLQEEIDEIEEAYEEE